MKKKLAEERARIAAEEKARTKRRNWLFFWRSPEKEKVAKLDEQGETLSVFCNACVSCPYDFCLCGAGNPILDKDGQPIMVSEEGEEGDDYDDGKTEEEKKVSTHNV